MVGYTDETRLFHRCQHASKLSKQRYCRNIVNGKQGVEFGVLHPKAKGRKGESREVTLDRQAGWAAATIMSKRRSHAAEKGDPKDFIPYLAGKYAPVGASNDPKNLNKNWVTNVSGWRDVLSGKKNSINEGKKNLYVFDFDDTLVHSTARVKVTDRNTGQVTHLTPHEYAHYTPEKHHELDFSEFHDVKHAIPIKGMDRAARNASRKGRSIQRRVCV